jgi:Tol biopolymer transport system component
MRVSRSHSLATFVAVVLSIAGCDDPIRPPAPGAIRVVLGANGEDIILDGLRVSVVNGPTRQLSSAVPEIVILGRTPGVHTLQLDGLAVNCQVASANPLSVTVVSNVTTTAQFSVFCLARTGSVRVTTVTTGTELDPDGYTAMVIDGPSRAVPVNGTGTVANVREGQRMVTLGGVAPNCAIAGADTATVTVQLGATVDVAFSVQCQTSGSLRVTVLTTGTSPDPDGYLVAVQATSVNFTGSLAIAPNGSVTFLGLVPAADYRVALQGVAANCDIVDPDVRTVTVTGGGTTDVAFDVSCATPRLIAVVRDNDIYVINSNGTGATRLTTDPASDGEPAWSSSGQITFTTQRHTGDTELYVMNDDGTSQVRLTTSAGADDAPSWSPDGQRIVFRSFRDVNSELYAVNRDGTGLIRLTNNTADDRQPAWSSSGKIAFVSDRDHPAGEIYVMNADGSNVIRLTQNDSAEVSPAWSPDGSMIAFARTVECYYGCTHDIFVMNADGSNVRRLATGWATYQDHTDPSWSPNGRAIAFTFTQQYCGWYYYYCDAPSLWLVDVQGPGLRLVADNAANPAWKP